MGEKIAALRDEQDMSRTELARRAQLSLTNLNLIERGQVEARLGTLETIAATLGVRVAYLIDEDAPPPRPKPPSPAYRRLMARLQEHKDDEVYLAALERIAAAVDPLIADRRPG
ncbi:MAG: helix-turn-helix domain-containing protein [Planctomycetota bacterium]